MDFNRCSVFNAGLPHDELYGLVTSAGVRTGDPQTGVLMYFNAPGWRNHYYYFQDQIIGERIARIRAAGGVIVHDSGDALMAEWNKENVELRDSVFRAVRCAFRILNECDRENRDSVKIVISAGTYTRASVGNQTRRMSVIFGPAGYEIRSLVPRIEPGFIVLSAEAWRLCARDDFVIELIGDGGAVMVHGIMQQQRVPEDDLDYHLLPGRRPPIRAYLLTYTERARFIHGFMMQASLEKLNEMWQPQQGDLQEAWPASVMFVNAHFARAPANLEHTCNHISYIMAQQMFSCNGEICEAFIFKEGCVFVCAVGLPGNRRHDRPISALLAAHRIRYMCRREIDCLLAASVGVTTGRICYTSEERPGRNKYTLHGLKVILAGSLTKDYPGTVSSDVETKLYSMLPLPLLMPRVMSNQYNVPFHRAEINELLADEATLSRGMDGGRLALAHLQTMNADERKVVKYAAAIGHTFGIEMLQSILQNMAEEVLATTIRTLFRVGIFECAFKPRDAGSPNICYCENNPEVCQLMSFCNRDEMEMVHKLMEKNLFMFHEIHTRCATYLGERRYRCSKCDAAHFAFAQKADQIERGGGGEEEEVDERRREIYKTIRPDKIFQSRGFPCQRQTNPAEESSNETEPFLATVKSMVTEARDSPEESSCECARLVETVLVPRARHWRCAGNVPTTFHYLLESASAYVHLQNDARALDFLNEAGEIMRNLEDGQPAFPTATPVRVELGDLERAFAHRLTGEIMFRAGKITEAERSFRAALKIWKCSLPRHPLSQSVKLIYEKVKKLHFASRQLRIKERRKLARLQECISCLSFLWQIGYMCGQAKSASLAITMEINLAIQSGSPFEVLYAAIDYLKYSQLEGEESKCRHLEAFLCKTCASLTDHPEGRRLIGHLTRTLAVVKLCAGDLAQSIEFTTQARELSEVLNEPALDVRTAAALQLPLLLTSRFDESAQQIKAFKDLGEVMSSTVATGYFYASCMNFLLYAGFAIRPFEDCLAFVEGSGTDASLNADKSLLLQLYSSVALWFALLENWERSAAYYNKACEVHAQIPASVECISGAVMLLECSTLLLSNESSRQRRTRTLKLFAGITQQFGTSHIFAPRVLHLMAFVHQLTRSKTAAQELMEEALLLCEKQGNLLDKSWIEQSQDDWFDSRSGTPA